MGTQSWSGLRALWGGIKRVASPLAMGGVGGVIGFAFGALVTACAWGVGAFPGAAIGAVGGTILGTRMAPRDVANAFVLAAGAMKVGIAVGELQTWDSLVGLLFGAFLYAVVAVTVGAYGPRVMSPRARHRLAVVLSVAFVVVTFGAFVRWIYRV
jgi:hypothetical protein